MEKIRIRDKHPGSATLLTTEEREMGVSVERGRVGWSGVLGSVSHVL
jgi:hypothetical protein